MGQLVQFKKKEQTTEDTLFSSEIRFIEVHAVEGKNTIYGILHKLTIDFIDALARVSGITIVVVFNFVVVKMLVNFLINNLINK